MGIVFDMSHTCGFLHRLDIPSSGLILTAKTYEAYFYLRFQLNIYTMMRDYIVLCHGCISPEIREINAKVYGKPSMTYMKVLAHLGRQQENYSLVAIRIQTGRYHQIRVHTKHIGHPTVCDGRYTAPQVFSADREWCPRNFLHRYRLLFADFEGRSHEVMMPLPADLVLALSCLKPKNSVSAEVRNE